MNQGCVRFLLLSAAVFASATAAWALALNPPDGELPLEKAAVLGLLGLGTVLASKSLLAQRAQIRLLEEAGSGIPPADGKRGAAVGELHPATDTVLTAPFSGKPALLYSYTVSRMAEVSPRHGKRRRTTVKAFEGDAMAPCEVRTAFGAVRILEPPILAAVPKAHGGPEAVARAAAYLDAASFVEVVSPGTVGEVRRKVEAEERESLAATGGYRYDGRISNPEAHLETPIDLHRWELSEIRFAPGETVTLLGRYDASRGGFTAVPTDVLAGVTLYEGSVAGHVRRKRMGIRFLAALALALLAAQGLVGGHDLRSRSGERAAARAEEEAIPVVVRLFRAVEGGDTDTVRRLLKKGADPASRDQDGQALSHAARDEAMLRLVLDAGAPVDARNGWGATPLTVAADGGDLGRVKLLLERGADPNARDEAGGTPLAHALDPAIRAALAAAGAGDPYAAPPPPPPPAP